MSIEDLAMAALFFTLPYGLLMQCRAPFNLRIKTVEGWPRLNRLTRLAWPVCITAGLLLSSFLLLGAVNSPWSTTALIAAIPPIILTATIGIVAFMTEYGLTSKPKRKRKSRVG